MEEDLGISRTRLHKDFEFLSFDYSLKRERNQTSSNPLKLISKT